MHECHKEPQKQEWCEHITSGYFYKFIKKEINGKSEEVFHCADLISCPICGTPRPKQPPLTELLAEKFLNSDNYFENVEWSGDPRMYKLTRASAERLAREAIEFLERNK